MPSRETPRRINGMTVVGRSPPPVSPLAATPPPYLMRASTLASVTPPTQSTAADQVMDWSGFPGAVSAAPPMAPAAPHPGRASPPPTQSTAADQVMDWSGLPGSVSAAQSMTSTAPNERRYSWPSALPVLATT